MCNWKRLQKQMRYSLMAAVKGDIASGRLPLMPTISRMNSTSLNISKCSVGTEIDFPFPEQWISPFSNVRSIENLVKSGSVWQERQSKWYDLLGTPLKVLPNAWEIFIFLSNNWNFHSDAKIDTVNPKRRVENSNAIHNYEMSSSDLGR